FITKWFRPSRIIMKQGLPTISESSKRPPPCLSMRSFRMLIVSWAKAARSCYKKWRYECGQARGHYRRGCRSAQRYREGSVLEELNRRSELRGPDYAFSR